MNTVRVGRLTLLVIPCIFAACATIISGSSENVTFHSTPEGAKVSSNGRVLGTTPFTLNLKKESGQTLEVEKDGYKTFKGNLETRMDPWFWGNIILGGFIGSTTDALTGSIYEYSPNQYLISLEPVGSNSMQGAMEKPAGQKARDFIIVAYKGLQEELNSSPGEYTTSLLDLLKVPATNRPAAIKKIRALLEVYQDIPDFADHVVELFVK